MVSCISKSFQIGLIFTIHCYRYLISGLLGHCCRFEPSCSHYAIEAIQLYGVLRGSLLAIKRIICCHPWHPGGLDPVPQDLTKQSSLNQRSRIC